MMTGYKVFPHTLTAANLESPNSVIFPAAIIQWPLFHKELPPAVLFGGFSSIVGHEITHGFDQIGRAFDADGKLEDWWTNQTAQSFENRTKCFIDQYSKYEVQSGLYLDGEYTLGENIADNAGLRQAWIAYRNVVGEQEGKSKSLVPSLTNDQLFFLQYGQKWCFKMTPQYERLWVRTNSHSTPKYRVQGVLSNMNEFAKAYGCLPTAIYNPSTKCQIW